MSDNREFTILSLSDVYIKYSNIKLYITTLAPLKYKIIYELLKYNEITSDIILNFDNEAYKHYCEYPDANILFGPEKTKNILYVENIKEYIKNCEKDYRLDDCDNEIKIIKNGIILPLIDCYHPDFGRGGVCDENGSFLEGNKKRLTDNKLGITSAYLINSNVKYIDETVVYGGVLYKHFGHFIVESLSRLWYFLENSDKNYKFVFISDDIEKINNMDFLLLLGLKEENIILLKEPTMFKEVIVPNQSIIYFNGFNKKAKKIYNKIRDAVIPGKNKNVYMTSTKNNYSALYINEEYFENYYRSIGYKIISMDELSVKEQISVAAGAGNIVCTNGTLHHHILFSHDGIGITCLNRASNSIPVFWINQMRNAKCIFIDVNKSFLPSPRANSVYLLGHTIYWELYIKDTGGNLNKDEFNSSLFKKYMEAWAMNIFNNTLDYKRKFFAIYLFSKFTLADLIINIYKYLIGENIDSINKNILNNIFNKNKTVLDEKEIILKQRKIKNYFLSLNNNINDPKILEIIDYFKKGYGFSVFPYEFTRQYHENDIEVFMDYPGYGWYVIHEGKKLYFPEGWSCDQVKKYYNNLCMEQDVESPHRYETPDFTIQEEAVIADIGAASGIWALMYAEKASKIYLFESDQKWIEPLRRTFEPWVNKVVIIDKIVSNNNLNNNIILDKYFLNKNIDFIKADIKGMELEMLEGSDNLLKNNNLKLLVCTYHKKDDDIKINEILKNKGFKTEYSKGYMIYENDNELDEPYLRRGLIRARK